MAIHLRSMLSGNSVQDSRLLDEFTKEIRAIQKERPDIQRHFSYRIEKKGERDNRRYEKSSILDIPDDGTKTLLSFRYEEWMNNPMAFWLQSQEQVQPTLQMPPIAQIASYFLRAQCADVWSHIAERLSCVALAEFCDGHPDVDINLAASALHTSNVFQSVTQASKNLNQMLVEGRKYLFLEHIGGRGILLVLGKDIPKSYWTKLSKKSGPRFDKMMIQLQNPHLQTLRRQFEPLRHALVTWLLFEAGDETPDEGFENLSFGAEQPILQAFDPSLGSDALQNFHMPNGYGLEHYVPYADHLFTDTPYFRTSDGS